MMGGPLMVIYLLRGYTMDNDAQEPYMGQLILPALGLHFPGTKDRDARKYLVRYRINRVAQKELLSNELGEDDLDDSEPDD